MTWYISGIALNLLLPLLLVRKVIAFILIIAVVGQSFNQGLCYLHYTVSKAAYEARCENKARPELKCHGKCQLMKKLAEQEERENGKAPELKLAKIDIPSSKSFFAVGAASLVVTASKSFVDAGSESPVDRAFSLFHPPNAVI